jgi:CHAD domain-containing protein
MTALSAGAGVHPYFAKQARKLRKNRKRVLRRDEDAVHQMRVATRRLRSLLSTYGHLYAETPLARKRLRWLAAALAEVRDIEVLRMRFARRLGQERPEWFAELCAEEGRAYERVAMAFGRKRFSTLMDAAEAMATAPHFTLAAVQPAEDVLAPDVEAAQADLAAALADIETAADPDAARHAARKAAKRARYTAQAAAGALGEPAAAIAAEAERIQSLLGRCQDDVVAIAYLEAHAPDAAILDDERRAHAEHLAEAESALADLR